MIDGKAYVVVQTLPKSLRDIEMARKRGDPLAHLEMHNHPYFALEQVRDHPVDMVVLGNQFYSSEGQMPGYEFKQEHRLITASLLADAISEMNPRALTLRFSTSSRGTTDCLVGNIIKFPGGNDTLVGMIDSPALPEILEARDWARLRAEFPGVQWYDALNLK